MMDTNEKNMLWNAVAVDMLSTVQEFCGTGLKQKNWDGKSTRERKKTRLAAQCANRHTHTHSANECGVCWQRECNRPVECVYILYCIYIYIYNSAYAFPMWMSADRCALPCCCRNVRSLCVLWWHVIYGLGWIGTVNGRFRIRWCPTSGMKQKWQWNIGN